MRVAVASQDRRSIDQHFGQASQFLIYDVSEAGFELRETRANQAACGAVADLGPTDPMQRSADLIGDCDVVLVARIGPCGAERLAARGITAFELNETIEAALRRLSANHRVLARRRPIEGLRA
jgi:predicted Fe-Mo cluster-binding NifX family protein